MTNYKGLIASDLDGTLYLPDRPISKSTLKTFAGLAENKIIRVIATGRSLFSAKKVIGDDFPIDYLVLSSGAVLMDWASKKIVYTRSFDIHTAKITARLLKESDLDFMIYKAFPGSHQFYFHHNGKENQDFDRRCSIYSKHIGPLNDLENSKEHFSQFVIILREDQDFSSVVMDSLPGVHVIRTTSPLDHKTKWIELFPENVSKASAIRCICDLHKINIKDVFVLGNDFNDLDMLKLTRNAYVLENAPIELTEVFNVLPASTDNALELLVNKHLRDASSRKTGI